MASDFQPLNASDFLKLAGHYHTLFLESIPRIGKEDKNTVRRFITLLDALYENKVNVILVSGSRHVGRSNPAF